MTSDPIEAAAMWLADQTEPPRPIIPALKARFGLSALQATKAASLAEKFRVYRKAHG